MNSMAKQKGFSLIELLIVVAIILVIAAIAIPNLMRARMAANDSSAAGSMHAINVAEVGYFGTYETVGFPATWLPWVGRSLALPASLRLVSSISPASRWRPRQERLQLCGHWVRWRGKPDQQPVLCHGNAQQQYDRHTRLLLRRRSGDPPSAGWQHHPGRRLCGVPGPGRHRITKARRPDFRPSFEGAEVLGALFTFVISRARAATLLAIGFAYNFSCKAK